MTRHPDDPITGPIKLYQKVSADGNGGPKAGYVHLPSMLAFIASAFAIGASIGALFIGLGRYDATVKEHIRTGDQMIPAARLHLFDAASPTPTYHFSLEEKTAFREAVVILRDISTKVNVLYEEREERRTRAERGGQ